MSIPNKDDEYLYNSEYYPQISDIKVKVVQSKPNFIRLKVMDEEFLNKELSEARKHQREYNDWENTLELFPFVSREKDSLVKVFEVCIFSQEEFDKKCTKL